MHKTSILIGAILALCLTKSAYGAISTYVKMESGVSILHKFNYEFYESHKPKPIGFFNIGLGQYFNDNFSADINLYHFPNGKFKKNLDVGGTIGEIGQKFKMSSAFINLNYEWKFANTPIIPFITAGVGVSSNDAGDYTHSDLNGHYVDSVVGKSRTDFAFNAGLGSKWAISDNFSFSITYRYFSLGMLKTSPILMDTQFTVPSDPAKSKLRAHSFMLGFIYKAH